MSDTTTMMIGVGCCCLSYLPILVLGILIGRGQRITASFGPKPIAAGKLRRQGRLAVED